ncbi:sortase [Candidatus Saccharibacteria bacterium]|nr:sortase [Candidatus Saccharibacteria bacterium]
MAKRLFALFLSSVLGLILAPNFLTSADAFKLNAPEFNAVETIIKEPKIAPTVTVDSSVKSAKRPTPATTAVAKAPANSISIAGRTIEIVNVASTEVDAGNHVNHFQNLLYGHNSATVFANLHTLGAGATFTITQDGVTKTYRVMKTQIYEKDPNTGKLQIDGVGNYMRLVASAKSDGSTKYDLSIMTCHGRALGGGDATHRFVVFANAI